MAIRKVVACACGRWVTVRKDEGAACRCGQVAAATVRYEVVVDGPTDGKTGKRKQLRRRFPTRKAASDWEAQSKVQVKAGTFVGRERITLSAYLDEWLAGRHKIKASTRENYRATLQVPIDLLGAKLLQDVSKADLDRMVHGMEDGSLRRIGRKGQAMSSRSIGLCLTILGQAMEDAVKEGRLVRNVAALVDKPEKDKTKRAIWSPEDVEAFLAAADKDRLGPVLRLSLHGLRRGEVCGLRWADLDQESAQVTVERARVLVGGKVEEGSTKTDAGERVVWLGDDTASRLAALQTAQKRERIKAGPAYQDSGYVAVDVLGQPLRPDTYSDLFAKVAKQAKLPAIRLHQARHGFISYLLHHNVPLAVVQQLVGHADPAVTLGTYTHVVQDPATRQQVREVLSAIGL